MMIAMRTICAFLIAASALGALADGPNAPPSIETRMSKPVPIFFLKNLDGAEVCSTNYAGTTRLVWFWASWDKPCQKQLPVLMELQRDYATSNVVVLGLSLDKPDAATLKEFAATNFINFPILFADFGAIQGFGGLDAIPTLFVVEPHGVIVSRYVGYTDKDTLKRILKAIFDSQR